MQWLMVISKVVDFKGVTDFFYEDISKILDLIDSNPNLDEEYKQASKYRFKQILGTWMNIRINGDYLSYSYSSFDNPPWNNILTILNQ